MLLLIGEHVLAHEVVLNILICCRGQPAGLGEQLGLHGQQVTENTRQGHQHINTGPTQLLEGQQSCTDHPAVTVLPRLCTQQRQRLCDADALGLEVIGPPQHERHGFG